MRRKGGKYGIPVELNGAQDAWGIERVCIGERAEAREVGKGQMGRARKLY